MHHTRYIQGFCEISKILMQGDHLMYYFKALHSLIREMKIFNKLFFENLKFHFVL